MANTLCKYTLEGDYAIRIDSAGTTTLSASDLAYVGNGYFIGYYGSNQRLYYLKTLVGGMEVHYLKTIKAAIGFLSTAYGCSFDGKYTYGTYGTGIGSPSLWKVNIDHNSGIVNTYTIGPACTTCCGKYIYTGFRSPIDDYIHIRLKEDMSYVKTFVLLTGYANKLKDITNDGKYLYVMVDGMLNSTILKYDMDTANYVDSWSVGTSKSSGIMYDGKYFYMIN